MDPSSSHAAGRTGDALAEPPAGDVTLAAPDPVAPTLSAWEVRRIATQPLLLLVSILPALILWSADEGGWSWGFYLVIYLPILFKYAEVMIWPHRFPHIGAPKLSAEVLSAGGPPATYMSSVRTQRDEAAVLEELIGTLEKPGSSKRKEMLANSFLGLLAVFLLIGFSVEVGVAAPAGNWVDVLIFSLGLGGAVFGTFKFANWVLQDRRALAILKERRNALVGSLVKAEDSPPAIPPSEST